MTDAERAARLRTANLLGALALEVTQRAEQSAKRHPNETLSSSAALNVIGFYDGCSNNTLAQALGLSHTATVRLVDKLEAAGLVTSETGTDRRSVALKLTTSGRERARDIVAERCRQICDVLDMLPEADLQHLERITETLLRGMVDAAGDADHICRLCDETVCVPDRCPVHGRAMVLKATDRV
ncbi:MarR family winged helix-turn-helix transcriptional regulator [Methyloraptor flagellatus]|uniref:MarR family transcriptional regulator n=1 Tax=Methyloraptor flagellatus TaxID=3162530 RepID=A0AAU7XDI9_9HYPH